MDIKPENSMVLAVYLGLVLFGIAYNRVVAWLSRRGYLEGLESLAVIFGVGATLAGLAVLDVGAAVLALGAFAASGLPMALGSLWRYVRLREMEQKLITTDLTPEQPKEHVFMREFITQPGNHEIGEIDDED